MALTVLGLLLVPDFVAAAEIHYPIKMPLPDAGSAMAPPSSGALRAQAESALSADTPAPADTSTLGQIHDVSAAQAKLDDVLDLLGRGVNLSGEKRGKCVKGTVIGPQPNAADPQFFVEVIKSADEFQRQTDFEASVSGGFASWRASASMSLNTSLSTSRNAEYLLIKETVLLKPKINLQDEFLDPRVEKMTQSAERFYGFCGYKYVSHVQMGGELVALLTFHSDTEEAKREFEAQFSASGPSVEASADFKQRVSAVSKHSSLTATVNRLGSGGILPETSLEGLLKASEALPDDVLKAGGEVLSYDFTKYDLIPMEIEGRPPPTYEGAERTLAQLDSNLRLAFLAQDLFRVFNNSWRNQAAIHAAPHKHAPQEDEMWVKYAQDMRERDAAAMLIYQDLTAMLNIQKSCAAAPWSAEACALPAKYVPYHTPPSPDPDVREILKAYEPGA